MIQLNGLNPRQIQLADILWNCKTKEQVDACITVWGTEAIVIRDMMVAAALDETDRTETAKEYLARFTL